MLEYNVLLQGTRMEERLDDAINVLRNHAESQLGLHAALASVTHSTPLYPHAIDSTHAHLVSNSKHSLILFSSLVLNRAHH